MLEDSKKDDFHIGKYNFKSWLKSFFVGIKVRLGIIRLGVSGSAVAIICKLQDKILYAVSNLKKYFAKSFIYLLPMVVGSIAGFVVRSFYNSKLY